MSRNYVKVRPEVLTLFVEFVRLNPSLPADSPVLSRVLRAYDKTVPVAGGLVAEINPPKGSDRPASEMASEVDATEEFVRRASARAGAALSIAEIASEQTP